MEGLVIDSDWIGGWESVVLDSVARLLSVMESEVDVVGLTGRGEAGEDSSSESHPISSSGAGFADAVFVRMVSWLVIPCSCCFARRGRDA